MSSIMGCVSSSNSPGQRRTPDSTGENGKGNFPSNGNPQHRENEDTPQTRAPASKSHGRSQPQNNSPPREPTPPPPVESKPRPRQLTPPPTLQSGSGGATFEVYECLVDCRKNPKTLDKDYANPPEDFPFVDYGFGPDVAIEDKHVDWKRPCEIRDSPKLFTDGTTRYDIGQGGAGTCWFLSIVAMLAEKPNLFHRVVSHDAWDQERGFFHCKFWRFGEWEDVYIDDCLPVIYDTELWGAKSAGDRNEMWPALLEKAFARFHGNYNAAYGGQSGDAFLALTGGCSQHIEFEEDLKDDEHGNRTEKALALHRRLKNAIKQGESMLTTDVPQKFNKKCGLVGGHAYSLTGAVSVQTTNGETVHLVRVRNPWGSTEWTGDWSDGSKEWDMIEPGSVPHANIDDGEFWINLQAFIYFFGSVTVCSVVPDFDKDGCTDSLNYCTTILGDWVGKTAAGFQNKIDNPRYMFELSEEGMDDDGTIPIVVQVCQKMEHRKANKFSIRVDMYKVDAERSDGHSGVVMQLLGEVNNVYKCARQMCNRYKVEPGKYVVVPSTMREGEEREFLIRIYTPSGLGIREITEDYSIMESSEFRCPDDAGGSITNKQSIFGMWRYEFNAGGQVSNQTFYKNPEIEFEIHDDVALVSFTLLQDRRDTWDPIGLRLFELDEGCEVCDDERHQKYLYDHYECCPRTVDGNQGAFVAGKFAEITHRLGPGRYFVILHMDQPTQERRFCVIMRSSCCIEPRFHRWADFQIC